MFYHIFFCRPPSLWKRFMSPFIKYGLSIARMYSFPMMDFRAFTVSGAPNRLHRNTPHFEEPLVPDSATPGSNDHNSQRLRAQPREWNILWMVGACSKYYYHERDQVLRRSVRVRLQICNADSDIRKHRKSVTKGLCLSVRHQSAGDLRRFAF